MPDLRPYSLKARNLKCFADWQGFDAIHPVNVIVGRNNAGKSALLDVVWQAVRGFSEGPEYRRGASAPSLRFSWVISKEQAFETFRSLSEFQNRADGEVQSAAAQCDGLQVVRETTAAAQMKQQVLSGGSEVTDPRIMGYAHLIRDRVGYPLQGLEVVRLRADRDVTPERSGGSDHISEHGKNATELVARYLHEPRKEHLVEQALLGDLNKIMEPDWSFQRIMPKLPRGHEGACEIYLEPAGGELTPLSHTGSDVKTVLLVLINLHLVPDARRKPDLSKYVFLFEELENNLHPAVQRRLFRYLRDRAVRDKFLLFLTTHSSAVIDLFSRDDQAQLVHVRHDRRMATVKPVTCHLSRGRVLDDLDVRASDLLQANVIVWVEGPSDRLYFNRWVELWSGGELIEQVHYQCVWYGGSNIAGVSFEGEAPAEGLVAALAVNRRAVVLMDSDRKAPGGALKPDVVRVEREATESGGYPWVTDGREVENYVPVEALRLYLGDGGLPAPGPHDDVFMHIDRCRDKVGLAQRVVPHITRAMLESNRGLADRLKEVCSRIRRWNGLEPGPGPASLEETAGAATPGEARPTLTTSKDSSPFKHAGPEERRRPRRARSGEKKPCLRRRGPGQAAGWGGWPSGPLTANGRWGTMGGPGERPTAPHAKEAPGAAEGDP